MEKKCYREKEGRKLLGVCIGMANYFDIDVSIVRLGWLIAAFCAGGGVLAYIIAALIKQEKPSETVVK